MAGSMMSGLLVAPMMKTFFLLPMPSISVRIWLMTLSEAPPASPLVPPLDLAMLSNSSKKRTQGEADLSNSITDLAHTKDFIPGLVKHVTDVGLGLSEPHG